MGPAGGTFWHGNVHFHKVFKGFRPIGKVLVVLIRSALLGDMQKHKGNQWFLKVPRGSLCTRVDCMHLLEN